MRGDRPTCYAVAGQNGAGKSTLTSALQIDCPLLDPDKFAREAGSMGAGARSFLSEFNRLVDLRDTFVFETTLSGKTALRRLELAKRNGMRVELHFVSAQGLAITRRRIMQRVARGTGHDVPQADQVRRFKRVFESAVRAVRIADESYIYDNSTRTGHQLIMRCTPNKILMFDKDAPRWGHKFKQRVEQQLS